MNNSMEAINKYGTAYGSSVIELSKEHIEALLNGKLLAFSDGEYNTYLGISETIENLKGKLTGYKDIDNKEIRVGMICFDESSDLPSIESIEINGEFYAKHEELDAEPLSIVHKSLRINHYYTYSNN